MARKRRKLKATELGKAIEEELSIYQKDIEEKVNEAGRESMKKLVKLTKADAPVGPTGDFKKHITSREERRPRGNIFTWCVKAPDFRITHLLVHGHAKVNGGRTDPDPFLANALAKVLPEYEEKVEEAIRK